MKKKIIILLALLLALESISIKLAIADRRAEGYRSCYYGESYHGEYYCKDRDCPFCQHRECVVFYLRNSDELELSEEQITKLKEIERKAKSTRIRNLSEVKILKLEIGALLDEKKPNLGEMETRIDKMSRLKAEVKKTCLRAKVGAKALLSAKQQEKAKELWKSCDVSYHRHHKGKGKEHHHFREKETD